jgi:hypothetical protein
VKTLSNSNVAAGSIVRIAGLDHSPEMLVMACDRTNVDCIWFNANKDITQGRFPNWSVNKLGEVGKDSSSELPVFNPPSKG